MSALRRYEILLERLKIRFHQVKIYRTTHLVEVI